MDLDEIRKTLEARLHELTERHKEDDSEERATEIADEEILEGIGSAGLNEVRQIKNALERLRVGTYGACTQCGEEIAERRLQAVPYAALCIKCADTS